MKPQIENVQAYLYLQSWKILAISVTHNPGCSYCNKPCQSAFALLYKAFKVNGKLQKVYLPLGCQISVINFIFGGF